MQVLMINLNRFQYKNIDSAEKLIRYITRNRENEDRRNELLGYGINYGTAHHIPIEELIRQFEFVQKYHGAKGSLMCHYTMNISNKLFGYYFHYDLSRLHNYAQICCQHIFNMGHQVCYAIHQSVSEQLHIHFAINTINFCTGQKLRQYPIEIKKNIEYPVNNILNYFRPDSSPDLDNM